MQSVLRKGKFYFIICVIFEVMSYSILIKNLSSEISSTISINLNRLCGLSVNQVPQL